MSGYRPGLMVQFERPGSAGNQTAWSGVIQEIQLDGSLLIRDTSQKLRVVKPDQRWLKVVDGGITPPPFQPQVGNG